MEEEGKVWRLVAGDIVKFVPMSNDHAQEIRDPRTTRELLANPEPILQKPTKKGWLTQLQKREHFMYWDEFLTHLEHDKMVHIVTDGGARQNSGSTRRGGLLRQNGDVTSSGVIMIVPQTMLLNFVEQLKCCPSFQMACMHGFQQTLCTSRRVLSNGWVIESLAVGETAKKLQWRIGTCGNHLRKQLNVM
jgi:hypothetical protein